MVILRCFSPCYHDLVCSRITKSMFGNARVVSLLDGDGQTESEKGTNEGGGGGQTDRQADRQNEWGQAERGDASVFAAFRNLRAHTHTR